jgi:hypothetical protein
LPAKLSGSPMNIPAEKLAAQIRSIAKACGAEILI